MMTKPNKYDATNLMQALYLLAEVGVDCEIAIDALDGYEGTRSNKIDLVVGEAIKWAWELRELDEGTLKLDTDILVKKEFEEAVNTNDETR